MIPTASAPPVAVLLVDDDASLRTSLARGLGKAGLRIEEAEDGRQALAKLRASHFDWIVTDIVMPEVEGLELVSAARKVQPHLKIIAMSGGGAGAGGDYLRVARHFGATHVCAKPVLYTELAGLILGQGSTRGAAA